MVFKLKSILITVALLVLAAPLYADTLVMFKNGKSMRVKSAIKDGTWLKCEFEDKSFISVPASGVLKLEEAVSGGTAGELRPNHVAAGTGGGYVPPPRDSAAVNEPPPPAEEEAVAAPNDEDYLRQPGVVGERRGSFAGRANGRAGIPITPPPGTNPGVQQGLQPLNQAGSPFPNRRLNNQRGSSNRTQVPQPTGQQPQQQSAQDE